MKRRQASTRPAVDDPKRRGWVASALRLVGLQLLTDPDLRQEWSIAWRRFEMGQGPLPIDVDLFDRALAAWPDRSGYPAILDGWRQAR